MNHNRWTSYAVRLGLAVSLGALVVAVSPLDAARRTRTKRPITKLKHDPTAESVELFDGLEEGQLDAWMVMQNSLDGAIFIENKTKQPLTVEMPPAVVGVHVLNQFGGGAAGGGLGGGLGGGQQGGGGGQQVGGGGGGQLGGGGGQLGGGGGGFFSIPPEQVAKIECDTVCLNHGKPEPRPKMKYRLRRVEDVTKNPVLSELLTMVSNGKLDPQAAQAAAWHLTDKMSWGELASKKVRHINYTRPYFSPRQLAGAQSILAHAQGRVREKAKTNPGDEIKTPDRTASVR